MTFQSVNNYQKELPVSVIKQAMGGERRVYTLAGCVNIETLEH